MILHGGPGAPGSADSLARALALSHPVLAPHQRRSGGPPLTVARHVADLAAVTPPDAVLVGHSWGAMLALSYATVHPVHALALIGCGTYSEADRALYQARLQARLPDPAAWSAALARQDLATLGALAHAAESFDPLDEPDDPVDLDPQGYTETWADVLRLQAEGIEPAAFAAIRAPVLLVHGAEDPHPGEATRDTLRPYLPQLVYHSLPRCGHAPWCERHARAPFLRLLDTWLAGLP